MKHLDLFSGIGGFALAARNLGWQTVAFCEIEPYCQAVLRKHWPDVPIYNDVRELSGASIGPVDIITGGYPCQPFSVAGKRDGDSDDRHLWPEMYRLVLELRPAWVLGENVAGHISMGLDQVLSDLERGGYACRALVIPAVGVDAPHRRERVWVVGNSDNKGESTRPLNAEMAELRRTVADTAPVHAQGQHDGQREIESRRSSRWIPEPDVGRVADGVSHRVDRLKALGNAIVPEVAERIFRGIRHVTREISGK